MTSDRECQSFIINYRCFVILAYFVTNHRPPSLYTQLIPLLSSYFIIALVLNNVLKNIFRICSFCIRFVCDIVHTWSVKDCASR